MRHAWCAQLGSCRLSERDGALWERLGNASGTDIGSFRAPATHLGHGFGTPWERHAWKLAACGFAATPGRNAQPTPGKRLSVNLGACRGHVTLFVTRTGLGVTPSGTRVTVRVTPHLDTRGYDAFLNRPAARASGQAVRAQVLPPDGARWTGAPHRRPQGAGLCGCSLVPSRRARAEARPTAYASNAGLGWQPGLGEVPRTSHAA